MPKKSKSQESPPVPLRWHYPRPDPADETPGDIVAGTPAPDEIRAHGLRAFFLCAVCATYRPTPAGTGSGSYCGGTGYGLDTATLAPVCYACCGKRESEEMKTSGRATLYLTRKPDAPSAKERGELGVRHGPVNGHTSGIYRASPRAQDWRVSNWPGSLTLPVHAIKRGSHNWRNVERMDVWFIFSGYVWHGVRLGDSDILRCKRTRAEWRQRASGEGYYAHTPRKARARKGATAAG